MHCPGLSQAHAVVLKLPKELCAARAEARKDHEGGVEGPRAKPLVFQMVARADKAGLPSLAEGLASVMVRWMIWFVQSMHMSGFNMWLPHDSHAWQERGVALRCCTGACFWLTTTHQAALPLYIWNFNLLHCMHPRLSTPGCLTGHLLIRSAWLLPGVPQ